MFIDENSRKLIKYLAANEPSNFYGRKVYAVSSLTSSFIEDSQNWDIDHLKPYLSTLKEKGYIDSYTFYGNSAVHIERTALLLHFDEYALSDSAKVPNHPDSNLNQNECPQPSRISPNNAWRQKAKPFFAGIAWILGVLASAVAVIDFCSKHF